MTWPACSLREATEALTAVGAPYEMCEVETGGRRVRSYRNAPSTLVAVLDDSRRFGERDFIIYNSERITFEAHWRAANAFSLALVEKYGVNKGDRIAIAMRNFPEWSVCAWGALAIGAVLVPLNAWETGDSLARMLADSGARLAVVDVERRDRLAGKPEVPALIVTRADDGDRLEDIIGDTANYAQLPATHAHRPEQSPEDLATIFYTSGTTGLSKGAVGTQRNLLTNLMNIGFRAARTAMRNGQMPAPAEAIEPRVQLLPLPFFHVTGFHSTLLPALANGVSLVLMYKWDAREALNLIAREQVNIVTTVPAQAWQLVDALSQNPGADIGPVQSVGYGGAAAAPALALEVRRRFPDAFPSQGYGATETSSLVAFNSGQDMLERPESVGVAAPCCDVRILDGEGNQVPFGTAGELWVSGPQVVQGYWRNASATEAAFVDGWYRTGDIATIDSEGFIVILDRLKDMLIRGGENIYCVEVENVIASHPLVVDCAVFGIPDRTLGEVVAAVVCVQDGDNVPDQAEMIRQYAAGLLPPHKVPVEIDIMAEPLPRNAAGKVQKREVRAAFLSRHVV